MRSVALVLSLFAAGAAAQQPTALPRLDSARVESTLAPGAQTPAPLAPPPVVIPPVPPPPIAPPAPPAPPTPPPPTLAQVRFQQALRTAGRGVAQLRDGLSRLEAAGKDSLRAVLASRRLSGLCGAARGFLERGRGRMDVGAYEDSTRRLAHQLVVQLDTLLRLTPLCEANAAREPIGVASALGLGLKAYDVALRDFRAATVVVVPPSK